MSDCAEQALVKSRALLGKHLPLDRRDGQRQICGASSTGNAGRAMSLDACPVRERMPNTLCRMAFGTASLNSMALQWCP